MAEHPEQYEGDPSLHPQDDFERRLEQEKLAALVELAYGASHEINNPLANIATRAQVLIRDEEVPERRRMLQAIHAQAMRAHEMIADLMLFARPPQLVLGDVDLNELVHRVAQEWRPTADTQATELAVSPGEGQVTCRADVTHLSVALGAVIRNALESLGRGGRVQIAVHPPEHEGGPLAVLVRDNGPGMSDNVRRHAFDPFFSGREAGRGLGFGLSKCWRIVDLHDGQVQIDSSLGGGTEVILRLPACGPSVQADSSD